MCSAHPLVPTEMTTNKTKLTLLLRDGEHPLFPFVIIIIILTVNNVRSGEMRQTRTDTKNKLHKYMAINYLETNFSRVHSFTKFTQTSILF